MRKHSRANFLYRIGNFGDQKVLLIWDKDQGSTTVTNDIENVVADIAQYEQIDPIDHLILYRDTDAFWCGWDAKTNHFWPIAARHRRLKAFADLLISE